MRRGSLRAGAVCALACEVVATVSGCARPSTREEPSRWRVAFDRPVKVKYEDMSFPTAADGWLVAASGDVLATSDGGSSWHVVARQMGQLRSVDFIDRTLGFVGTLDGHLFQTYDGGATWSEITERLPLAPTGFCGITHTGSRVHAVGRYVGGKADYFTSSDSGRTWAWQDLRPLAQGLVDVAFLDDATGLIGGMGRSQPPNVGSATILRTTDGGATWRTVFADDGGRGFAWKIFPVSELVVYVALQSEDGTYRMAKSVDGGASWETRVARTGQTAGVGVQAIGFLNEDVGWIGGFFGGMYETRDGGLTWRHLDLPDRLINRFERAGDAIVAAGTRGVLRYDSARPSHPVQ